MSLAYSRPRKRAASTVVGVTALSLLGSSFVVAPAQAAEAPRSVSVSAQETQGLPGQYMVDQSKSGSLWVTSASGRPPIQTGTLAKVNPKTLKIEAVAQLPEARTGTGEAAGYQYVAPFGVAVDDNNGNVWVTNTRTNSVSVFRQSDMKLIWTDFNKETGQGNVTHPREVIIDDTTGRAFVGASDSIHVYNLKNFSEEATVTNPSAQPGRQAKMNLALDAKSHRLFVPDLAGNIVEVYDTQTLKIKQTINLKKTDESASLSASDIAFDASLNELFVSSQGENGKNSGAGVYDATTGAFKKFISFGNQALALDNDEQRDLVYISDFSTGKVGVIDAKSDSIISNVQAGKSGANDIEVLTDGSVVVVNKATFAESVTVPFTLAYASGVTKASNTETKGAGQAPSPISANSMVRFTVSDRGVVKPAPVADTQTVSTADGATVTGVKVLENGKAIEVSGTGWKDKAQGGSVISVKADKGALTRDGNAVISEIDAAADGTFKATIPFPSTANGYNTTWAAGDTKHTLHFLSGSGKDGDVVRAPILTVTVGEAAPAADSSDLVTPTNIPFTGYPAVTDSDPENSLVFHASFTDVEKTTAFANEIQWVGDTRVAEGWEDGTYRPHEQIERAAMAAYLYRLAGSPRYTAPEKSPFTDVAVTDPFYKEIAWLQATGITTGWPDGTFRPHESISRGAMAAFMYRAAGSPEYVAPTTASFNDVEPSSAFFKEISWMKAQKISTGWSDNTYRAQEGINRDAMAAFMYRFQASNDVKVVVK